MNAIHRASRICDGEAARALLGSNPVPSVVRAVASRADELRFNDPSSAVEVATAALEAQVSLPTALRRPRLVALTWWVFGSCCRAQARFDEAEFALNRASSLLPPFDARSRAEVARRFADLRADQRRGDEARELMAEVLEYWRRTGGRELGKRLCTSGAILIRLGSYLEAARDLEEAMTLLAPNGDRFHLSAVYNLAVCRLELGSSRTELKTAERLLEQAARLVKPGSIVELRWYWINGNLQRRLGRFEASLAQLQTARAGIDQKGNGFDRALLLLDLTELHFERGEPEAAREVALSSFGVMAALRNEPLALQAMKALHRAAQALGLDQAIVRSVRGDLVAARS